MAEAIINEFLKKHNLEEVVSGTPIDVAKVPRNNQESVAAILLHCCINGPVSPHKSTTYPVIGDACLQDLVGDQRITNSGLKKTCEEVAKILKTKGFHSGFQIQNGDFWPLNIRD